MENERFIWAKRVALALLLLDIVPIASGQDDGVKYRHTVTAGVSASEVTSESGDQRSSTLGFDYLYRLDAKWEVGFQVDRNYDRSFEHHESDAIVPIISYSLTDELPLFLGVGVERVRSTGETETLARVGFEYNFYLDDEQRLTLLPGGFIDFLDGKTVLSAVIALGYSF